MTTTGMRTVGREKDGAQRVEHHININNMWGVAFGALAVSMIKDLAIAAISVIGLIFELISAICDMITKE